MASQGTSSPKIHVLAFPVPGQGHITPMMHLCKKIAARDGFIVSFVNVDSLHDEMIKHWRAPSNTDLRLVSIPLSWKIPHGLDAYTLTHSGEFFKATTEMIPALEHLVSKLSLEISPVRCIISDYFFFWTQDVADKFGIPRIVLWPGSAAWTTIEYHIPELIAGGHVFPSLTEAKKLVADESIVDIIKGLGPLHQADVPLYLQADDHLWAEYSVQRVPYIRKASCVLVNSFYDLEPEASDFMAAELRKGISPSVPCFSWTSRPPRSDQPTWCSGTRTPSACGGLTSRKRLPFSTYLSTYLHIYISSVLYISTYLYISNI
ncbi:UDP-glycosyltransferase 86A1 [Selaginella moellendorffii]|uniref:UDP-glycosyltransferase 86A1 n=1 Tax=Selaginella moellendorffii TaxID=88036 RepID=UPI000D1CA5AE|nr:UDP-glycosyltransferase 86A1 [Selaginella moellendorffii]|eukprot:XP_024540483.1 UDP-glycosyltransferase 86A1 [Selaginella moellendorffii]